MKVPSNASTPGKQHYALDYLGSHCVRLASYREQIANTVACRPESVLIVGPGDGIVTDILRQSGIAVTTLDVQEELQPDILASVDCIPAADQQFDAAICCQVLEHLEFDRLVPSLRELRRVTKTQLVLSLPDDRRFFAARIAFPRFPANWQFSLARVRKKCHRVDRQDLNDHAWEIGFAGSSHADVCARIREAGWRIQSNYRVFDYAYHAFFCCR